MTEPNDAEEIRNGSDVCHWCSKEASCMHCSIGIEEDETYQFCGGDSYMCEECSNKPGCAECEEIIDGEVTEVGGKSYHEDCAPETE